ncbi:ATP-binding protein [Patescibacteria group bacterium]|nr:ATP-binding protein [Patescibacteria group bacterium]
MKIARNITTQLINSLKPAWVVVLYGPRRTGKTTLVKSLLPSINSQPILFVNGDEIKTQRALSSQDSTTFSAFIGHHQLLIIDEAQRIPNIGLNLKLLIDTFPQLKIIATGSATFDLANKIAEPLTGRKTILHLYPLSFSEIARHYGQFETEQQLERWLVWGGYPQAILESSELDRADLLQEITGSYLYKDILDLQGLKRADKIINLLRLLAFQIGSQVSLTELGTQLNMDFRTIEKYLELLEKSFVIYRLGGFSRNLRKEVAKTNKYYFYDNGIRNALIENFNPLQLRNDTGQLFENYLMIERQKKLQHHRQSANRYFWRTYDQQELDLVEESGGQLRGFEFKWSSRKKPKTPKSWLQTYDNASYQVINQDNYVEFIT